MVMTAVGACFFNIALFRFRRSVTQTQVWVPTGGPVLPGNRHLPDMTVSGHAGYMSK